MDFFETVTQRHSYRGPYREKPVSRDELVRIVDAGIKAPSGMNRQTTRFIIVDAPELVDKIQAMHPKNTAMQQAAAYILCIIDRQPEPVYEDHHFQIEDCAAAAENMLLAITALGYASVWVDGWLRRDNHAETIGNLLKVPADKLVRIILPVGVPAEHHTQKPRQPFTERCGLNAFPQEHSSTG